jgi:predicted urease superfamily metal-dependent hydrolase
VLSGVALCAVLVGPVAVAQANNNTLRKTLNTYAPKIVKDENAVKNGLVGYPHGKVRPLVRALKREVRDLHRLRNKLAHERASSRKGKKAKNDIIKGLSLIASAYGALRKDVQAAHGGPVPKRKVNAAIKTDKQGRKKLLAGLHLLS